MTADLSSAWYRTTPDAAHVTPEVAEQAVEWAMALQEDDVAPHVIEQCRQWRAGHPDHERAWQRIEAVNGNLKPLFAPTHAAVTHAALTRAAQHPKRSDSRRRAIKALALLVVAGGAAHQAEQRTPWRSWTADHRSQVGEQRTVMLDDGTQVVMNTDSAIDVRFDASRRRIRLVAGEVLVRTASRADSQGRPFLVETAQGTARALGTWYAVRQQDGQTAVSVFEGAVRVQLGQGAQSTLTVQAGQRTRFTEAAIASPEPVDEAQIAWRDGVIEARSMRLDDFLDELGRYTRDTLACDPAIAGLRVSGSFPVEDVDRVLASVALTLGVQREEVTQFWGARRVRMVPATAAVRR